MKTKKWDGILNRFMEVETPERFPIASIVEAISRAISMIFLVTACLAAWWVFFKMLFMLL